MWKALLEIILNKIGCSIFKVYNCTISNFPPTIVIAHYRALIFNFPLLGTIDLYIRCYCGYSMDHKWVAERTKGWSDLDIEVYRIYTYVYALLVSSLISTLVSI